VPFRFTGFASRLYTQYRDLDADAPLHAFPGGTYDMAPAGGLAMPVPPGDGNWADIPPPPPPPVPPAPPPPAAVPVAITAPAAPAAPPEGN